MNQTFVHFYCYEFTKSHCTFTAQYYNNYCTNDPELQLSCYDHALLPHPPNGSIYISIRDCKINKCIIIICMYSNPLFVVAIALVYVFVIEPDLEWTTSNPWLFLPPKN